jgi:hypothetical protein
MPSSSKCWPYKRKNKSKSNEQAEATHCSNLGGSPLSTCHQQNLVVLVNTIDQVVLVNAIDQLGSVNVVAADY